VKTIPIAPLDSRKQLILKAVVTDYVRTAEPVGSHVLAARYEFGVRSATIRNEMAELADLGYLHQPHTSAGRIPSDQGYRFYVDRLMDSISVPGSEMGVSNPKLAPRRTEMDVILEHTCRLLSELAHYTSLASQPSVKDAIVLHISVAMVARSRALVVVVLDNGGVLHDMVELGEAQARFDPVRATSYLSRKLVGRSLDSLNEVVSDPATEVGERMNELLGRVVEFVRRELQPGDGTDIHLEGASYIMQQPEFRDAERLEAVLSVLEQRSALYRLFSSVYLGEDVTIIIGTENPLNEMCDCSFVGKKYRIRGRVAGTLGVVGPTRMDYRRAVGAVNFMVGNLEQLLTDLSVS